MDWITQMLTYKHKNRHKLTSQIKIRIVNQNTTLSIMSEDDDDDDDDYEIHIEEIERIIISKKSKELVIIRKDENDIHIRQIDDDAMIQKLQNVYCKDIGYELIVDIVEDERLDDYVDQEYEQEFVQFYEEKSEEHNSMTTIEDFEYVQVIGSGAFATVYLVRCKKTDELLALKVMDKDYIRSEDIIRGVLCERDVMEDLALHPFVVELKYAFQTNSKLYLAMNLCQGGDLFFQLKMRKQNAAEDKSPKTGFRRKTKKRFTEEEVLRIAAEIALGISSLHDRGYAHRDLKLGNILVDKDGHIRITDFGHSRYYGPKYANSILIKSDSFCGTTAYLSPEIINGDGHYFPVDWWAFGVILYELSTGKRPFYHVDNEMTYENIRNVDIDLPLYLSDEFHDLVLRLLDRDPETRLCSKFGISELAEHPAFEGVDWNKAMRKEYCTFDDLEIISDPIETTEENHIEDFEPSNYDGSDEFVDFDYRVDDLWPIETFSRNPESTSLEDYFCVQAG